MNPWTPCTCIPCRTRRERGVRLAVASVVFGSSCQARLAATAARAIALAAGGAATPELAVEVGFDMTEAVLDLCRQTSEMAAAVSKVEAPDIINRRA